MYYNMSKKIIRLTESDLRRIVKESVKKIIREDEIDANDFDEDDFDEDEYWANEAREEEEHEFYNLYGNQSQYPAYEYAGPFEGELGLTAQYDEDDYNERMNDYDPEYFLDGQDPVYRSKKPGDYRTNKSR